MVVAVPKRLPALPACGYAEAEVLSDTTIGGFLGDSVAEIRIPGKTLQRWRTEILAHHHTAASNGPTEGLNLLVKEVKRCGRGFENFEHYRLRVLLRAGRPRWPQRPSPPILRTPRPHARVEPDCLFDDQTEYAVQASNEVRGLEAAGVIDAATGRHSQSRSSPAGARTPTAFDSRDSAMALRVLRRQMAADRRTPCSQPR